MEACAAVLDRSKHPCFNVEAKGSCGRVHLPVAPRCNIQCNYCNRRYDCVNESRPGVTSGVLAPRQAVLYVDAIVEREPSITVVGIAGPGDPFANPDETMETLRLIREHHPRMLLCVSTNALGIAPHIPELARLDATHVTVTVNAVRPNIGEKIYAWVRDGKKIYRGRQAAEFLLARQMTAILELKRHGITVKVNTIVIPGVNDHHVEDVAHTLKGMGVDLHNCMAMAPNAGTAFEKVPEPGIETMNAARAAAEKHLPQMRHCQRCRADAVGLLHRDRSIELSSCLKACAASVSGEAGPRPYVAVATQEGLLVNQHLGEADRLQIWGKRDGDYAFLEERDLPPPGGGDERWRALAHLLRDCRAVLVSGVGERPTRILSDAGVKPMVVEGLISLIIPHVYDGRGEALFRKKRDAGCRRTEGICQGTGTGCA